MTIIGQRRAMPLTIATEGLKLSDVGGEDVETLHLLLSDSAAHTIGSVSRSATNAGVGCLARGGARPIRVLLVLAA